MGKIFCLLSTNIKAAVLFMSCPEEVLANRKQTFWQLHKYIFQISDKQCLYAKTVLSF